MTDASPHFDDTGRLIAPRFEDVYFSAEDGLAETQYVFLAGNNMAERFASLRPGDTFTIGETGFGTGLNFIAAWQRFEQHAPADAQLEFISVEGFPLTREVMERALSPWPELERYRERLLEQWDAIWPGEHRLRFAGGRVRLTLLVGEVDAVLTSCDAAVDAWFLDGFAPSRNPAMWSKTVFKNVGRCSRPDTTLATYTAAGFVRRGLQAVGFDVQKQPGFGTKRDMTFGIMTGGHASVRSAPPAACKQTRALVIGGSLAGAFAARALAERDVSVVVVERQPLVDGELPTLMPRVATLQPKISSITDANGQWLREGYASARRRLASDHTLAERCGWQSCGTLQLAFDDRSEKRLRRFVDEFGQTGLCRWIDVEETESICGIAMPFGGVSITLAGVVRPAALCAGLLDHPNITLIDDAAVASLTRADTIWQAETDAGQAWQAEVVVAANALQAMHLRPALHLDLHPVRGQVTTIDADTDSGVLSHVRCPVFYGGYVLPVINGRQSLGASFIPNDTDTTWRDQEHHDVCDKLAKVLPEQADRLRQIEEPTGWAGLRVTTKNHRCYAEQIDKGLYVSLGHGSHGISSAARAADHIADLVARRASA